MTRDEALFVAGMRAGANQRLEGLSDEVVLGLARREFERALVLLAPPEVVVVDNLSESEPEPAKRGRPKREQ